MPTKWITERWREFAPKLDAAGGDESAIKKLCEEELAAWHDRPSIESKNALRKPLTDFRNMIRALPLTPDTSHQNTRTQAAEHIALLYMNFDKAQWVAMSAPTLQKLRERPIQLIESPEAIVDRAVTLLESFHADEMIAGLALLTGRRLSEILSAGELVEKSTYTAMFSGQLKRRDKRLRPFEVPTLAPAGLVVAAWRKLRNLHTLEYTPEELYKKYHEPAAAAADAHFSAWLGARPGREKISTHTLRTIYMRIAVYWFCPAAVQDLDYMSHISGHYWELAEGGQEYNYSATMHYNDYRIGDGAGNIDGRQGLRLANKAVVIVAPFGEKKGHETMPTLETKNSTKTGFSMLRPKEDTRMQIDQIMREENCKSQDSVLALLVREHYALKYADQAADPELIKLLDELRAAGVDNPAQKLRALVAHDEKFKAGVARRYANVDYSSMKIDELARTKTPEAAAERYSRAVFALMAHNMIAEPIKRWYINANLVRALVGGRPAAINEYLAGRQADIDEHHARHDIAPSFNRKPYSVESDIIVE